MTSKHPITAVSLSAAIVLKLLAGTPDAAPNGTDDARRGQMLLTVLHDASERGQLGRGIDIARVDAEIVNNSVT